MLSAVEEKYYRWAAHSVLGIVLLLILFTFLEYGVTWDEELQSQYGQAVVDYYASGFKDQRYAEIFNLYIYGGMFDGLASAIDHYTPFRVYDTRHVLNALFGLLGLWGTWRLGRRLGGSQVGFIALLLCAATPMYYGHMFNNPKDIPFAAGIVWSLYYMMCCAAKPKRAHLIKLGFILGMTLGVRVGGVMIIAFWLAPLGCTALRPLLHKHDLKTIRSVSYDLAGQGWRTVLPVVLIAYGIMLVCWPWAQQHPLTNPLRALGEFSNFPQDVEVLLDGTTYRSTQLPWYYVPLYFGIQLPELLLALLANALLFLPLLWRRLTMTQQQGLSSLLLMIIFPISYAVIRHPALYDAVRHFLFTVPLACILAALGLKSLLERIRERVSTINIQRLILSIIGLALALGLATQITIMIRLHPYEYIYANQFAGGVRGAYGHYELDYWGSSFKQAAERLQALVAGQGGVPAGQIYRVAICGPWDSAMIYLPPDYRPVVANEPAEFFLSTTRWKCQDMRPGKEVIRIERIGVPLSIIKDLRDGYEHYPGNDGK